MPQVQEFIIKFVIPVRYEPLSDDEFDRELATALDGFVTEEFDPTVTIVRQNTREADPDEWEKYFPDTETDDYWSQTNTE